MSIAGLTPLRGGPKPIAHRERALANDLTEITRQGEFGTAVLDKRACRRPLITLSRLARRQGKEPIGFYSSHRKRKEIL
jgi:hypothetical protein